MNREFSKREKVLLLILVVILLFVGYLKLYMEPLNAKIEMLDTQTADAQAECDTNMIVATKMRMMEQEIEETRKLDDFHEVPKFDNSRAVMKELYAVLNATEDYVLNFGEITRMDYIVSRPVYLTFITKDYDAARKIIDELSASEFIVELGNVNIRMVTDKGADHAVTYQTKMDLTYFEAED